MGYYPKIDGLRFVAIFLVLFEHFVYIPSIHIIAGYYGVDLFFVISGFLITGILIKTPEKPFLENYKSFIVRRILRIFPIYYLTVIVLLIAGLPHVQENLIYLLTYTFNYAIVFKHLPNNPINPFWSLSVEEQFYLFWPLVVLSFKNKLHILLVVSIVVVIIGYSQQLLNIIPSHEKYNYFSLFTRMSSLGLGAVAIIAHRLRLLSTRFFTDKTIEYLILMLIVFSLVIPYKVNMQVLGLSSFYLVLKAAFYGFKIDAVNNFLKKSWVIYVGSISYGIYLFHLPLSYYVDTNLFKPIMNSIDFSHLGKLIFLKWYSVVITFPLYSLLTVCLASLSYRYFEKPFLKLKARFKY